MIVKIIDHFKSQASILLEMDLTVGPVDSYYYYVYGGVSGSSVAGLWSMQVMLETWVRIPCERASQF